MNKEQRRAEFDRLFLAIPGRNIDRLNKVAGILCCKTNTLRICRLKTSNARAMPEAKLRILRRELEREGIVQPPEQGQQAVV